jgi:hypothetical protein
MVVVADDKVEVAANDGVQKQSSSTSPLAKPAEGDLPSEDAATSTPKARRQKRKDGGGTPKKKSGEDTPKRVKEVRLPHAEPVKEAQQEEAVPVVETFGEELARCAFSPEWNNREAAFKRAGEMMLKDDWVVDRDTLIAACVVQCKSAFQDRIMNVFLTGLQIMQQLLDRLKRINGARDLPPKAEFQKALADVSLLLVKRLGDSKDKIRTGAETTLFNMCSHASIGPGFILDRIVTSIQEVPRQGGGEHGSLSPTKGRDGGKAIASRLGLIIKMLAEFEVGGDSHNSMDLQGIMDIAIPGLENREKNARDASNTVFEVLCRRPDAKEGTLGYVAALRTSVQKKLLRYLVDKGAVEEDLIAQPDDFDDFQFSEQRPGTAANARPVTALKGIRPNFSSHGRPGTGASSSLAAVPTTAMQLPHAPPLSEEAAIDCEHMVGVFGDQVIRCLMDRNWATRVAALNEVQLQLCAASANAAGGPGAGSGGLPPRDGAQNAVPLTSSIPSGDPKVLMMTSELLEIAMADTVARVYQTGLVVLEAAAAHYLPTVPGGGFLARAALQPSLNFVVTRLGDSKERLRIQSQNLLLSVSRLPFVGCRLVADCVVDMQDLDPSQAAPNMLAGRLLLLERMTREFASTVNDGNLGGGESARSTGSSGSGRKKGREKKDTMGLQSVLDLVVPSFDNRHVDVRNAAVKVYAAIYEVTGGTDDGAIGSGDANMGMLAGGRNEEVLAGLNPLMRAAISECIVKYNSNRMSPTKKSQKSERGQAGIHSVSKEKMAALFGQGVAEGFVSKEWRDRRQSILDATEMLMGRQARPAGSSEMNGWELCSLLLKQGLMDSNMQVRLVTFDLLHVIANPSLQALPSGGGMGVVGGVGSGDMDGGSGGGVDGRGAGRGSAAGMVVFPWDEWEARLLLASTVKSIADKLGDESVRVRNAAQEALLLIGRQHEVGLSLVARQLLVQMNLPPVPVDDASGIAPHAVRVKYGQACRLLAGRLKCVLGLLGESPLPATGGSLALDTVLSGIPTALSTHSTLVNRLATDVTASACELGGKSAVQSYLASADGPTLRALRPLVAQLMPDVATPSPRAASGRSPTQRPSGAHFGGAMPPRPSLMNSHAESPSNGGGASPFARGMSMPPRPNMGSSSYLNAGANSPVRVSRSPRANRDSGNGGYGMMESGPPVPSGIHEHMQANVRPPWSVPNEESKPFTPGSLDSRFRDTPASASGSDMMSIQNSQMQGGVMRSRRHRNVQGQNRAPTTSDFDPLDSGIWRAGDNRDAHGVSVQPMHSQSVNSGGNNDNGTPLWLQSEPAAQSMNAATGGGLKGLRALRDSKNRV